VDAPRQDPRANQKARTRAAIVEAARQLSHTDGEMPTVAAAAASAGVSRATAYRYFPTQEALAVEVSSLDPLVASTEAMLASLDTDDVEERLLRLIDTFNPVAFAEEEKLRRALWVYLDTWLRSTRESGEPPALRAGRRMEWLARVMEPVDDLPDDRRRRLQAALALTLGGDSMVIMKDVCGLEDAEALAVLRWAATAMLRAGLAEDDTRSAAAPRARRRRTQ
jgi:AcrR family transcriptional regulator